MGEYHLISQFRDIRHIRKASSTYFWEMDFLLLGFFQIPWKYHNDTKLLKAFFWIVVIWTEMKAECLLRAYNNIMKSSIQGRTQKTNSLTEDFIYSILGQEETYRRQKNKANLTRLIELYRKLVEFYSQKNDKINIYFMDKISQLSSEIPLLQEADEKLTLSMARDMDEENGPADSRFKSIATTPVVKYDPEQKKKERSKNAQIAIEVSKVKKRTNARTILKSYYEQCLQNNNLINADLQMQRKQLEEKLMAIHKKSMEVGNKKIVV